jgi:hypothetical protein
MTVRPEPFFMTLVFLPLRLFRLPRARRPFARLLAAGLAAVLLSQLAGCAAQLWPPSAWSLSVDLPFMPPRPATEAPVPSPPETPEPLPSAKLKDPTNASEALAYAEALCKLPPEELSAEIERLKIINAQDGHAALRAQQLAFAQQLAGQLAPLYAEQQRLQESNEQQAQLLRERQKRIEQLNGQIAAMRAVEDSLPLASPVPPSRITNGPVPAIPPHADPDKAGSSP